MSTAQLTPSLRDLPLSILRKRYDQMTPEERRLAGFVRQATQEEFDQAQPGQAGAPADFAGRVLPNPNNVQISEDTDSGIPNLRLPNGVQAITGAYTGTPQMDASNPAAAQVLPAQMQTIAAQNAPDTLPADFQKWDAAPETLPADFKFEENKTETKPPSAVSRLKDNFLQALGVTTDEGAKQFFQHPIKTFMESMNAQGELATKAKEAYDKGDYKEAVRHGINYLLPFIGQSTEKAGTQLQQGDYAGGIGTTLGTAAPIVLGSPEVKAAASEHIIAPIKNATQKFATSKSVATVPVRLVARGAETAINQKLVPLRPLANIMTPADEAEATQIKVPGRDYGLPKTQAAPIVRDATRSNVPFAGEEAAEAPKPKGAPVERDATRQNAPYAGEEEPIANAAAQRAKATPEAPATPRKPSGKVTVETKPKSGLRTPSPSSEAYKQASVPEGTVVPEANQDMTSLLQKSLDNLKVRKGGVMATAEPEMLTKRWGVTEESLKSGREQTRGMGAGETEAEIKRLEARYRKGDPVEPVMETRDANNNIVSVDGRGRAIAAMRAGVKRIPIIVRRVGVSAP